MKKNLFEFIQGLRTKKQKLKGLAKKLRDWSDANGDNELLKICEELEDEAETMDDGSNPGGDPPPPPGKGG